MCRPRCRRFRSSSCGRRCYSVVGRRASRGACRTEFGLRCRSCAADPCSSIAGTSGPLIALPTNICSSYPNIAILDLSSNSITGLLNTSELACLGSNLIKVDFSNNFINNIDTDFFKSNRKLQTINLSHNNLITMPIISAQYFINFTSTITSMNFSYNQIISVDFWPIFVKTRK